VKKNLSFFAPNDKHEGRKVGERAGNIVIVVEPRGKKAKAQRNNILVVLKRRR